LRINGHYPPADVMSEQKALRVADQRRASRTQAGGVNCQGTSDTRQHITSQSLHQLHDLDFSPTYRLD
jgi:hypothetical protein